MAPLMSYKRRRNLQDILVRSEISVEQKETQRFLHPWKMVSFPCIHCINCKLMTKGSEFVHPISGKIARINKYLTCDSDWCVYVLWCPCSLIYIGETTCTVKTRLNGHRFSIRKQRMDLPVSRHFTEAAHGEWELRFMILDRVPPPRRGGDRLTILKKLELKWIHFFQSLKPNGLNIDFKITQGMFG